MSSTDANGDMVRGSAASKSGDLTTRIVSAAVLGPIVVAAIIVGGVVFALLVAIVALLAVREWVRLVLPPTAPVIWWQVFGYGSVVSVLVLLEMVGPLAGVIGIAAVWLATLVVALVRREARPALLAFGVPYACLSAVGVLWLRGLPDIGMAIVLWLSVAVWSADIGAYAAGRSIGGPRLAPLISPKKTWAGLIGAIVAGAGIGGAIAAALGAQSPWVAAALAAVLALVAQGGDLFESAVKRSMGVKDSGRLIPGHGGVLDRMDGFFAAAPVLAFAHAGVGDALAWW